MNYRALLFVLIMAISCNLVAQKKWYAFDAGCTKHGHAFVGRKDIADYVDQFIPDTVANTPGRPVTNEDSVVAIAEPFLITTYGQQQIESERPYEVYKIDGYWILAGTSPADNSTGGTAWVIINPANGIIVKYWFGR